LKTKFAILAIAFSFILTLAACGGDYGTSGYSVDNNYAGESAGFPFGFTAEDLRGNEVTEAALGEKELFFVYFWTTWCPSCVRGIPGLAELAEEFGDRVGFLSLLGDFGTARESAITITENAGAPFITVDARLGELAGVMGLVGSWFVPTSIIIDASGNVIGEQIVGAGTDRFRAAIEAALGG